MEFVGLRRAAAMSFLSLERTNPSRKPLLRRLAAYLGPKYNFLKYPKTVDEILSSEGLVFTSGEFGDVAVDEVRIFPNGVMAATGESTDKAEALVGEVLQAFPELGMTYSPDMIQATVRESIVVVRSEMNLAFVNPALDALVKSTFSNLPGPKGRAGFMSVGFFTNGLPDSEAPVRVERLVNGAPNEFYAVAPIPTDQHLAFLEAFEKVLLTSAAATALPPPSSQSQTDAS